MNMRVLCFIVTYFLLASPVLAQTWSYTVADLPYDAGAYPDGVTVASINDAGTITGSGPVNQSNPCILSHALLWDSVGAQPRVIASDSEYGGCVSWYGGEINNGPNPVALVNDSWYSMYSWHDLGYTYAVPNGPLTMLTWGNFFDVAGVNDNGMIAGNVYDYYSGQGMGAVQPSNGSLTYLCLDYSCQSRSLNIHGEVVGQTSSADGIGDGFIWDATGGLRAMGCRDADSGSQVNDINDLHQAVGTRYKGGLYGYGYAALFWHPANGCRSIPESERFTSINDRGQAVGSVNRTFGGQDRYGQVWDPGFIAVTPQKPPVDLTSKVHNLPQGHRIWDAIDINNAGQIIANCVDSSLVGRPCVLTPVPNFTITAASWSSSKKTLSVTVTSPDNALGNLWLWNDSNGRSYRAKMLYSSGKKTWSVTASNVATKPANITAVGNAGPATKAVSQTK